MNLNFQRLPRHKGHFFCFGALSHGETGERHHQIRKPWVTLGREREWIKPFPSLHSPNRPSHFIGIRRRSFCIGEIERSLPTGPRLLAQFCSLFFFFASFRSWKKARFKSVSRFLVLPLFEHSYFLHESLTVPFLI